MKKSKKYSELILILCLHIFNIKAKYRCGVDLNKRYANNKNQSYIFIKRKLDDGDDDFDQDYCYSENEFDSEYFEDLNIYLDKNNLYDEINSLNLNNGHKKAIDDAIDKASQILESFLQIYNPDRDSTIEDDFFHRKGIHKWNADYIKKNVTDITGMFNNGIHYIIMFKFGDGEIMGNSIASAEPIIFDEYCLQPEIGIVTLNPTIQYSTLPSTYLETVMLHEFTHLLGFHKKVLENYGFINKITDEYNIIHNYIKTGNVTEYANSYFNCDIRSIGVEIETDEDGNPGSHWSSRILLGEYMTDYFYLEEQAISGFTLALFNDLRYLRVKNKYTGGLMRFGKHKGCNFLKEKCIDDELESKYENEFYYPTNLDDLTVKEPSCSSGRQSRTVHKLNFYGYEITPIQYRYFPGHNNIGGLPSTYYCPISQYESSSTMYEQRCSEKGTLSSIASIIGESLSESSFCALSSLVKINNIEYSNEVRAVCFKMHCSELSLTIQFGEDYFVCPREGGKINGEGFIGYLLCPDYNLICTGENKICNDMLDCLENSVEEKPISYDYVIETTQYSFIYQNQGLNNNGWEKTTNGICPQNCMQCKENNICIKCKSEYGLIGSTLNNEIKCEELSVLSHGYYQNSNLIHYPCMENCDQCENENICTDCIPKYKIENNRCIEMVLNCDEYNPDNISCKSCKPEFVLVINNIETSCKTLEELNNQYYKITGENGDYYVKCSEAINNCEECTSSTVCTKCMNNYGIINDDKTKCEDLSKYYFDNIERIYKLCSTKINGCEKCSVISNNKINCNKCQDDYVLINGEISECREEISIENDHNIFTDDGGKNYYFCSDNEHHYVNKCATCINKETCESCQNGYTIYNSQKLCLLDKDINDKKYYKDPEDNYFLCSAKINGCNICNDGNTCIECNSEYNLSENDKCIHSSITLNKYYLNPITGKYVSCATIENCEECISSTECTKCQNNYSLNNKICEKNNDDENYNKLQSMVIAAIVLGVISSVISIGAIILLLLFKKIFIRGNRVNTSTEINIKSKDDKIDEQKEEEDAIVIKSNKRSIHNDVKNNT